MARSKVAGISEVSIDNALGTLIGLRGYVDTISALGKQVASLDVTAFSDTAERVIAGIEESQEFTISGAFDDTATTGPDVTLSARVGTLGSWVWSPMGTGSGARKFSGEALCIRYTVSGEVKGRVNYEAVFKCDGSSTIGTY